MKKLAGVALVATALVAAGWIGWCSFGQAQAPEGVSTAAVIRRDLSATVVATGSPRAACSRW